MVGHGADICGELGNAPVRPFSAGLPMPGEIDGDNLMRGREGRDLVSPESAIGEPSVNEDDRGRTFAPTRVGDPHAVA
jgi:hypothetical protein